MLIELFEIACNQALEHDPETRQRLLKLQGKSMTLHMKTIGQSVTLTPSPEGVELSKQIPDKVDVTLSATLSAMLKISRDGIDDAELKPGELEISGDPIIGQRFARVLAELNIDWQTLLADRIGDTPARAITLAAGQAREFAEQTKSHLHSRFTHFVRDELAITVEQQEVDDFLDNVDTLRADTDRLTARIRRIQKSQGK